MANESTDETRSGGKPPKFMRYFMAVLASIGMAILYGFKVNVSIVLVAMVNHTAMTTTTNREVDHEDGPFLWGTESQDVILSGYFIGYLISMLPGARMSELISAKLAMNIAVLMNFIPSLLSPVCAHGHYLLFTAMRIIQGIGGGVSFPAMHVLLSKWAPPSERSVLTSISYSGTSLGMIISNLLSGILAKNLGWQSVFYIEGSLCIIWTVAWTLMVEDSPEKQKKFISQAERDYIVQSLAESKGSHDTRTVPWLEILKSVPFWAILVAHVCSNYGFYMILTKLPTFLKQVCKLKLYENTMVTFLSSLGMWIFMPLISKILSMITDRKLMSVTVSRKIGTTIASMIPMTCLIVICFTMDKPIIAVVCMILAVTTIGAMYSGFLANHIDIGPNYAGTLVAMTNFIGTVPGIIVPYVVGGLVDENDPESGWRVVFAITCVLFIIECIVYWIFGSGKVQPFNNIERTGETVDN